jgi:hypothetical protein
MPRKTQDQSIVTGLSVALTYAAGAMFHDLIENSAAFVMRRDGDESNDSDIRRATMLADLLAIGGGVAMQTTLRQTEHESLGRAGVRTAGQMITYAGIAGFTAGFMQDLLRAVDKKGRFARRDDRAVGATLLGTAAIAALADYRRRRRVRGVSEEDRAAFDTDEWNVSPVKSLAMGGAVTATLMGVALGERVLSAVTGEALESGLPGGRDRRIGVHRPGSGVSDDRVGHGKDRAGLRQATGVGVCQWQRKERRPLAHDGARRTPARGDGPDERDDHRNDGRARGR